MANRVIYCVSTPFGRDIDCFNSDTTLMVSNQLSKNELSICIVELVLWSFSCGAGILARLLYKAPSYRYLDIDKWTIGIGRAGMPVPQEKHKKLF